jgi:predicted Zn-dependent protease
VHPEMRFRFEFPDGWTTSNEKASVSGQSSSEDAVLQVSLAEEATAEAAAYKFLEEDGLTRGDSWGKGIHGLPTTWNRFEYSDADTTLQGTVAFVEYDGKVFQLLALTTPEQWDNSRKPLETALASFSRLDDPKALNVKPQRLRLVKLSKEMTLEEFDKKYPSVVEMKLLALINHAQPGERLPAGTLVKRVVEGDS